MLLRAVELRLQVQDRCSLRDVGGRWRAQSDDGLWPRRDVLGVGVGVGATRSAREAAVRGHAWLTAPRTEGFTVLRREEVGTERRWSGTGRGRAESRHGREPGERMQSQSHLPLMQD